MENVFVADVLQQIGTILEIKGENPFKSRAYFNAARVIESLPQNLANIITEDKLGDIEGIGEGIKEKITTLIQTGKLPYYEELKASIPKGLLTLLKIPGLGPKKIKALYEKLDVTDIPQLEKACQEGKVASLEGFGEKTASNILAGIKQIRSYQNQHRYGDVIDLAEEIVEKLRAHPDVIRTSIAGSLRRCKEVIGDIDILASAKKSEHIMDTFCSMPGVLRVLNHGETKSSVLLEGGIQSDLRVVEDHQYPYALHYFTGSKEHNVAARQLAINLGMKMSEWGLFKGKDKDVLVSCRDETELFRKLGMDYIPPELRENLGEIEAAQKGKLPRLLEWTELRGTLHCHTTASDGKNSLAEMAQAADELGFEYLGIADHSKSSFQANGLSAEKLLNQVKEIHAYNAKKPHCVLLAGVECDILKDGKLDFEDDILSQMDYVVASVHSSFTQPEEEMTKRIIRAIENPHVKILGHLTGRLLLQRPAYAVNIPKIIDVAAETDTWIELNAHPYRMDMDWRWWKLARDKGVKCIITPDAHATSEIGYVKLGVHIARKGWLRKEDVTNTLPLEKFLKALKKN